MIGHNVVRRALESGPPLKASLFIGPNSVGKWTLAEHLITTWEIPTTDVIRIRNLNIEDARTITEAAQYYPVSGTRLILVRLDGASQESMNVLLKTMEDASEVNHFILVGSVMPLETVASRCAVFHFSLLSEDEVCQILVSRKFSQAEALRLSKASGGRVGPALMVADGVDPKEDVLLAMKAITERDRKALDGLATHWTDNHTVSMGILCREAITGRWGVFKESEVSGLGKRLSMQILAALKPNIRPRLVVRASLMSVLGD